MHHAVASWAVANSGKLYVFFLVNLRGLALNTEKTEKKRPFRFTLFVRRRKRRGKRKQKYGES